MRSAVHFAALGVLLLVAPAGALDVVAPDMSHQTPPAIRVLSSNDHGVTLSFELPRLVKDEVSIAGQPFVLLAIPGGSVAGAVGAPAIPTYLKLVAVPEGAAVHVRAIPLEEVELTGLRLLPVQAGEGGGFDYNAEAYQAEREEDARNASVGPPTTFRDLRVIPVAFQPVRYDPATGTVRIAHRMRVEVEFEGGFGGAGPRTGRAIPPSFDRMYRELVLNYDQLAGEGSEIPGTCLVICRNNPAVVDSLQRLVSWRTRKGMPTLLHAMTEVSPTATQIKTYIQSVYNDPNVSLEYVVLAGDVTGPNGLATWYESYSGYGGEGDLPYSQLSPGALLPEVHVGRLSWEDYGTLGHIITKIIGYESAPYVTDPLWFTRSCIVGDPNGSGASTIETGRWLAERLAEIGYTEADTIFADPFVTRIRIALNRGDTVFGYRGFGGMSGWSNGQTDILSNGWRMPFAATITCGTGIFASGTGLSEGFLRAWNSSTGAPRGAIGAIGMSTNGTHTRINNCLYMGIWRGFAQEGLTTMGAARTRGCVELYLNYQSVEPSQVQVFSHWANLMGDPAVDVLTAFPQPMTVTYPLTVPRGSTSITVTATDGTNPVEGAVVCLWKGSETYTVRTTDAAGAVDLPVNTPTTGPMQLTVSRHNMRCYTATISVTSPALFVAYSASTVDDDNAGSSQGNDDGVLNPGEIIELPVRLENTGTSPATGVQATLATTDPWVTVTHATESYGTIPAGGTAWSPGSYLFQIRNDCPDGHAIPFTLSIDATSFHDDAIFEAPVISADLVFETHTVYGDDDGVLEPGETRNVILRLRNQGHVAAANVSGTLTSLNPRVSVVDAMGTFGTIAVGATAEDLLNPFRLAASPGNYDGYLAAFQLVTRFSGTMLDTARFTIPIGTRVMTDPTGPDAFGYLAFDDSDTEYPQAPVYSWVELDPAFGGNGTEVVLGDYDHWEDKSRVVSLPFPFEYYGETFSEATICSNGWVSFGSTILTSYFNYTIPGAAGPNGMLAVFWDDLYQAPGSKVFQRHDAANHRWIVEWSRMRNIYSGSTETFEVILGEDGVILYQYLQVVNDDFSNAFATVGIESPDQLDGVLYTYWNHYEAGASLLAPGHAIKFIAIPGDWTSTGVEGGLVTPARPSGLGPCSPNPFNPDTRISYRLAEPARVRLAVCDVSGRLITTLVDGDEARGEHLLRWDGRNADGRKVSPGVYYVRMESPGVSEVRAITLVR